MGVLDEAIRQHLELKRKHGAEEGEIARQEREALGPPQREPAAAAAEGAAEPEEPSGELHAVGDPEPAPGREAEPHDEAYPVEDPDAELGERYDDAESPEEGEPPRSPDDDDFDDDTAPPAGHAPAEDAGHEPPADPGAPAEDVLEETPDFLQETPEHDRLWFEQKPPRDFDFDE